MLYLLVPKPTAPWFPSPAILLQVMNHPVTNCQWPLLVPGTSLSSFRVYELGIFTSPNTVLIIFSSLCLLAQWRYLPTPQSSVSLPIIFPLKQFDPTQLCFSCLWDQLPKAYSSTLTLLIHSRKITSNYMLDILPTLQAHYRMFTIKFFVGSSYWISKNTFYRNNPNTSMVFPLLALNSYGNSYHKYLQQRS